MSSAFYPLGMSSYNNRLPQGGYETWKGRGVYSNPVGITSGNLRPLTNNDPANDAVYKFGLPRPIKHYRRGTSTPVLLPPDERKNLPLPVDYYYYSDRQVKSSVRDNMVSQLIDTPGRFSVKDNKLKNDASIVKECQTCDGIGLVSSWYPINNLSEKPQLNVTNPLLCCNQQRKARQRVLPANTNLKKNYYTTHSQYLYNRCQTFEQRSFNFVRGIKDPKAFEVIQDYPFVSAAAIKATKPGDPLSYLNLYVANCNPNGEISAAADIDVIQYIAYVLFTKKIITQLQYDEYKKLNLSSIPSFLDFLKTLPEVTLEKSLTIAYEILYNPYNGPLISGPSNPKGCKLVEYKPNNPQFAQQGAVSSSTRNLKLNVTTIERNAAQNIRVRDAAAIDVLSRNTAPFIPFVYKNKAPKCNPGAYIRDGNPKTCFKNTNDIADNKYAAAYSFNTAVNQLSDMTSIVNR